MAIVLRDEMSIQVDIPDELDSYTMREAIQLIIAIVLETLFILARIMLIGFFILRWLIETSFTIGYNLNMLFTNPFGLIANWALEYGRYYQG